jgi:hypothetical protein
MMMMKTKETNRWVSSPIAAAKGPKCGLSFRSFEEEFLVKQMAPMSDICIIRRET